MVRNERRTLIGMILPRTLAGIAVWLLLIAIGVAGSGVAFYAFYQYRLGELEQKIDRFTEDFEKDFKARSSEFNEVVKNSKADIEKASKGLGEQQINVVDQLLAKAAPSIAYVRGEDPLAAPTLGSGFAVSSKPNETWVLTSYRLVAGLAPRNAPAKVRLGDKEFNGDVYTWDETKDLALLIVKTGNVPVPEWEPGEPPAGTRVWAIGSAPGKHKAGASGGFIVSSSPDGYLVDAAVPAPSAGGPLMTSEGKIVGVLSLAYAPAGYPASDGWVIPIRLSCGKVIRCP
ncbi:MAG: trypsin-like peptidase domain-containing protein [Actinomycetota bacterium]